MRDWWTEADNKADQQKTARLVAQFSAYEVLRGLKVNGELTLGENFDDLTGDERFFMGWAHVWRAKQRDDALRQQVLVDGHSPSKLRVNGPLGNVPEFYAALDVRSNDNLFILPDQRVKT